jgi:hypothetical protein
LAGRRKPGERKLSTWEVVERLEERQALVSRNGAALVPLIDLLRRDLVRREPVEVPGRQFAPTVV